MKDQHSPESLPDAPQTLLLAKPGKAVVIEASDQLYSAEFHRAGPDLVLVNPVEADIRIVDYFRLGAPADLIGGDGGILRGDLVARLAGPEAPGQYAQAGAVVQPSAIGQVEKVEGAASVQRADGTTEPLSLATQIYMNDVVQTGADGTLSITFVDGTIFTLTAGSRMVIDSLIYDAAATDNSATFDLVQGGFVFIAGQVARTGGMDVTTPAATMGIRGTTVLADVESGGGISTVEVTLTRDPNNDVGRVELFDTAGALIATITSIETKWIVSTAEGAREVERTAADDASDGLLIAEAVSAFTVAQDRFAQEGAFLTSGSNARGPDAPAPQSPGPPAPGPSTGTDPLGGDGDGTDTGGGDTTEDPPAVSDPVEVDPPTESEPFDEGQLDGPLNRPADEMRTVREDPNGPVEGSLPIRPGLDLDFRLVEGPRNGTLTLDPNGNYSYRPDENFNGTDGFVYEVTDIRGETEQGKVDIDVLPVNDAPVIANVTFAGQEDTVLLGTAVATDVDGDALSYRLARGAEFGTVVVAETGDWTYRPEEDFDGTDSFRIEVRDGNGGTATQTVRVNMAGSPDAPAITSAASAARGTVTESVATQAAGRLIADDPDTGAELTWTGGGTGDYGRFTITKTGEWQYTLDGRSEALAGGTSVQESFLATVTDDTGLTATQTVRIAVNGTNDGPRIDATSVGVLPTLAEGDTTPLTGRLLATDVDTGDTLTWSGSQKGTYGTFEMAVDGSWSYTQGDESNAVAGGVVGRDSFVATVTDSGGARATQTMTFSILGENDAPQITGGTSSATIYGTSGSTEGQLDVTDPDEGAVLTWTEGTFVREFGVFTTDGEGGWTYTSMKPSEPTDQNVILESVDITVKDEYGATDTQTVTVTRILREAAPEQLEAGLDASAGFADDGAATLSGALDPAIAEGLSLDAAPLVALGGLDALDLTNGTPEEVSLTLSDIFGLSEGPDAALEELLGRSLPESARVLGDPGDWLTLETDGAAEIVATGESVEQGGETLDVYTVVDGGGVLATLAVDSDVAVTGATAAAG